LGRGGKTGKGEREKRKEEMHNRQGKREWMDGNRYLFRVVEED